MKWYTWWSDNNDIYFDIVRQLTNTPVTHRSVNAVKPLWLRSWPKQADCSVTFIIHCVAVTRHDFSVTPPRLIERTAARPSYDAPTNCSVMIQFCRRVNIILHWSKFTIISILAISSARMMDLGILHRFLLLLLELIPGAIGRRISASEKRCEKLISNPTCRMKIIGLYRDEMK